MPSCSIVLQLLLLAVHYSPMASQSLPCSGIYVVSTDASYQNCYDESVPSSTSDAAKRVVVPVASQGPVAIRVFVHVVTAYDDAGVPIPGQIGTQLSVLNHAYRSTGFSFTTVQSFRHRNPAWVGTTGPFSSQLREMVLTTRQGGANDLNLYILPLANLYNNYMMGYGTYPWNLKTSAGVDAVMVDYRTLPKSNYTMYEQGKIAVQMVGNWLGLYHTFQGHSCSGPGDEVNDTPQEWGPARECKPRDSCPQLPGKDPINNYMAGTPDACKNSFTPGQIRRLKQMWPLRGSTAKSPTPTTPAPKSPTPTPAPKLPTPKSPTPKPKRL